MRHAEFEEKDLICGVIGFAESQNQDGFLEKVKGFVVASRLIPRTFASYSMAQLGEQQALLAKAISANEESVFRVEHSQELVTTATFLSHICPPNLYDLVPNFIETLATGVAYGEHLQCAFWENVDCENADQDRLEQTYDEIKQTVKKLKSVLFAWKFLYFISAQYKCTPANIHSSPACVNTGEVKQPNLRDVEISHIYKTEMAFGVENQTTTETKQLSENHCTQGHDDTLVQTHHRFENVELHNTRFRFNNENRRTTG